MIRKLFETHLLVTNLEDSSKFYEMIGLQLAYTIKERRVNFFWIGKPGQQMLGIWEVPKEKWELRHLAFEVDVQEMRNTIPYLKSKGLQVRNHSRDGLDDLEVVAWMPAVNIYFRDLDGNSLEFISMLPDSPKPELGIVKYDIWEQMHGR